MKKEFSCFLFLFSIIYVLFFLNSIILYTNELNNFSIYSKNNKLSNEITKNENYTIVMGGLSKNNFRNIYMNNKNETLFCCNKTCNIIQRNSSKNIFVDDLNLTFSIGSMEVNVNKYNYENVFTSFYYNQIWLHYNTYNNFMDNLNYNDWMNKKNKSLIFLTNCKKDRNEFLNKLSNIIEIDYCGYCTIKNAHKLRNCPDRNDYNGIDTLKLVSTYKYFLSFENTICKYYITEKFYRSIYVKTIPIVINYPEYDFIISPNDEKIINLVNINLNRLLFIMEKLQNDYDYYRRKLFKTTDFEPIIYRNIKEQLCCYNPNNKITRKNDCINYEIIKKSFFNI